MWIVTNPWDHVGKNLAASEIQSKDIKNNWILENKAAV